jgi:two-component system OmpR family response regulator
MRVLLVDDDPAFTQFAIAALEQADIAYATAGGAEEGLARLRAEDAGFDVILLDIGMPGRTGWDFLLEIREHGDEIPVIFVTGNEDVEDRVRGLRMGADDYLIKPVQFEELVARLEAVLRRRRALVPIQFGDLVLDLSRRKAERNKRPVDLSPREYDLLLRLVRAGGRIVSREQLLREVWDGELAPDTNVVEVHVGRVRKKLDRHGRPLIETVGGVGFGAVGHVAQGCGGGCRVSGCRGVGWRWPRVPLGPWRSRRDPRSHRRPPAGVRGPTVRARDVARRRRPVGRGDVAARPERSGKVRALRDKDRATGGGKEKKSEKGGTGRGCRT